MGEREGPPQAPRPDHFTTNDTNGSRPRLAPHHAELISSSAISDAVRDARGYHTVSAKAEAARLGFARNQQSVPSLVIPLWSVTGERCGYMIRPDEPRILAGKVVKYEHPRGARMHIDVPPGARAQLRDPAVPLWITEGSRKADAAVTAGLCCVALAGVWSWRGTLAEGGKAALGDWDSIPLNRRVNIAFDSDVSRKKEVMAAALRLREFLKSRGADVWLAVLPDADDGSKLGLDDYLAAGHTVEELEDCAHAAFHPLRRANTQTPALASSRSILEKVVETIARMDCVGEPAVAQLIYLGVNSRLLAPPARIVSTVVKGPSAGGKSFIVETTLRLFPPEAFYELTSSSEHALAYSDVDLAHRMLVIYEAAGMASETGSYLIRSLLSEGRIRYETVEKTPEGLKARLIEREGPTGLITTTTLASLHPENETRLLSLTVDDSQEQTRRVMQSIARQAPAPDVSDWQALQAWLAEQGPHRVEVPYAAQLAELIPAIAVRLRRDFGTLLGLIRSHALLHTATREHQDGATIASFEDYAIVRELALPVLADAAAANVHANTRATVEAVAAALAGKPEGSSITVAQLAKTLKLDVSSAWRRARVAISNGYLSNLEDRPRRPARLVLGDPLPEHVELLPTAAALAAACEGLRDCTSPEVKCDARTYGATDDDLNVMDALFERVSDPDEATAVDRLRELASLNEQGAWAQ